MSKSPKTVLICPTLNAGQLFNDWVKALKSQSSTVGSVIIVDSGSSDETVSIARDAGFDVRQIAKEDFNHGRTRQTTLDGMDAYDIAVFMTQDAVLSSPDSIANLLSRFEDESVAAVCGRQLPRQGAGPIEAHARSVNYPTQSFVRSIEDVEQYGLKTAFLSNSFAAYRINQLKKAGGFPADAIFGEDMFVAAKLLKAGYKIAYAADACVYHSHAYTIYQEFKRYFDMGVFHANEPWIRKEFGGAEGEGVKFVVSEAKYLIRFAFWRMPEAFFRTFLRYTGFRLGLLERRLPLTLKRLFAMNKGYFEE